MAGGAQHGGRTGHAGPASELRRNPMHRRAGATGVRTLRSRPPTRISDRSNEIVVTGTRLRDSSPTSPVQVFTMGDMDTHGDQQRRGVGSRPTPKLLGTHANLRDRQLQQRRHAWCRDREPEGSRLGWHIGADQRAPDRVDSDALGIQYQSQLDSILRDRAGSRCSPMAPPPFTAVMRLPASSTSS